MLRLKGGFFLGGVASLVIAEVAAAAPAMIYDFKGHLTDSYSTYFHSGDEFELKFTFASPLNIVPDSPATGFYDLDASSFDLLIGGVSYATPLRMDMYTSYAPRAILTEPWFNYYGVDVGYGGYFADPILQISIQLSSNDPIVLPDGELIGGFPLSELTAKATVYDKTFDYNNLLDPEAPGTANVVLTSYAVENGPNISAVPEPSTYGIAGAAALIGLAVFRRRR